MCDENPLLAALGAAAFFVLGAIASIIIAIGLNGSFWLAPGAPGAMIAAGVSTTLAVGSLVAAYFAMSTYFACMVGTDPALGLRCKGALDNFLAALFGLIAVLTIQAAACFAAAGVAWIPWVGSAPMWVILATLIIQAALISTLTVYFINLRRCLRP